MTTTGQWLKRTADLFDRAGIHSARLDSQLLLTKVLGVSRGQLLAHQERTLSEPELKELEKMYRQRLKRMPMAYILQETNFYGRNFTVNRDVLIPRPETEQLVQVALEVLSGADKTQLVLDVGTGSGVIAITLALEHPAATVHACDISSAALTIAKKNAKRLGAKVKFFASDLLTNVGERYDVIVANLPYVDEQWAVSPETNYEPAEALFAGSGGLALYERLIPAATQKLIAGGQLLIEADPRQNTSISRLANESGYSYQQVTSYVYKLGKL